MERAHAPGTGAATDEAAPPGVGGSAASASRPGGRLSALPGLRRDALFRGRGWTLVLLAVDALLLTLGNVAAIVGAPAAHASLGHSRLIWAFPPLVVGLLALRRMYRDSMQLRMVDGLPPVVAATSLAAIALIAGAALLDPSADPAPLLARAWLFGTLYVMGGRALLAWAQTQARVSRLTAKPTLIVGAGQIGSRVERRLRAQPELGLLPVGYLDADPPPPEVAPERQAPVLGAPPELARIAEETGARHVVLGFSSAPDRELIPFVHECEALGLEISVVPRLFENVNVHVALEHLGGLPLYGLHSIDPKGWHFAIKHTLDRIGAAVLLVALLLALTAITVAVRLTSPGPVLFRQRRIGRDGREFEILKFRTMYAAEPSEAAASNVVPLRNDIGPGGIEGIDRRTPVGKLLRRTSLDELPQLLNVLRGDMSLIGPRPERPEFVDLFGSQIYRYGERHRVKSGITGWAQVHGFRGKTSLRDRVEWDNYYIENWSLWLDLKIVLLTLLVVFRSTE